MVEELIIVVGAGAAGLMAARELLRSKKKVIIIEGQDRIGGRIYTLRSGSQILEAGAEFVHGDLPLTLGILKEYGISYRKTGGKMVRIQNGRLQKGGNGWLHWDRLLEAMRELKTDMVFADFLSVNFPGDAYAPLRQLAKAFAEGYDIADINKVSTKALYEEWAGEEEEEGQYRIDGGYGALTDALWDDCRQMGCELKTADPVKKIEWSRNKVSLCTKKGITLKCNKVIITVPLGVLLAPGTGEAAIQFDPTIETQLLAASQIGYGSVIKILLECKKTFWEDIAKNAGFLFLGGKVPTWWTQFPEKNRLLTGWAGGPTAALLEQMTESLIFDASVKSLAAAFEIDIRSMKSFILNKHIFNWKDDPYSLGAYSFPMLKTKKARKLLNEPVLDTLFFAGEGISENSFGGTVEAALESGLAAAGKILKT
ncbi:MAG TPA: NAD(P)/FAD-dependent oxidoreductase [Puia sp.]|nr:NAD(P)/FAD-dependent oxidoreductase [Puia sp.]